MARKRMIIYNTADGTILRGQTAGPVRTVLNSGAGLLTGTHVTSVDLDVHAQDDVSFVYLSAGGVKMKRDIDHWVDDTHVVVKGTAKRLEGPVTWELVQETAAVQFTAQEKTDAINAAKADWSIDTVDAMLVETDAEINSKWHVNTGTGQLEKRVDSIIYE